METRGASERVEDFVEDLGSTLYAHLPQEYQERMEENVDRVILGSTPPYFGNDVGVYYTKDDRQDIYLSRKVTNVQDPHEIAEVYFHEFGHPLIDDRFDGVNHQTAADFLTFYALEEPEMFARSESDYERHEDQVRMELGPGEEFRRDIESMIEERRDAWFDEIERKYRELLEDNNVREDWVKASVPGEVWGRLQDEFE